MFFPLGRTSNQYHRCCTCLRDTFRTCLMNILDHCCIRLGHHTRVQSFRDKRGRIEKQRRSYYHYQRCIYRYQFWLYKSEWDTERRVRPGCIGIESLVPLDCCCCPSHYYYYRYCLHYFQTDFYCNNRPVNFFRWEGKEKEERIQMIKVR